MTEAPANTPMAELGEGDEPPKKISGQVNPRWLAWRIAKMADLMHDVVMGTKTSMPHGFNISQALEFLQFQAKTVFKLDPKRLMDERTDMQIAEDVVAKLIDNPDSDVIFENNQRHFDAVNAAMDKADEQVSEVLAEVGTKRYEDMQRDIPEEVTIAKIEKERERRAAAKKKWRELFDRIMILQDRATNPVPKGTQTNHHHSRAAAHPLRFMVYVTRTTLDGSLSVPIIGYHHAEMAVVLYNARTGWYRDWHRCFANSRNTGRMIQEPSWEGAMFVLPPGHGKTHFAASAIALLLSQNPRLRFIFGHAQAAKATENLGFFSSFFDPEIAAGRRNRALFDLPAINKNNTDVFDLCDPSGEKKKAFTVTAYGMTAKISGSDTDLIWFDDPCDQELAEQETTRKRIFDRMNGTWRTRKRGQKAFEIITTTLWHHDDPNAKWAEMAEKGTIKCKLIVRRCGGPDQNFKPLWPEVYPASYLKNKYTEMRNPRLYAAAYQSNPQPDELRKIKKLALYDPTTIEHEEFMLNARFVLSIDPAATNNEKADHAAIVYAALGDVPGKDEDGLTTHTRRLRIIDAEEFHATQGEAVDRAVAYARNRRVDEIFWEARSGFKAGPEMLRREFGLDVTPLDPGNRKKGLRLSDAAPLLDASLVTKGLPPASVEFPGRVENGTLVFDPDLAWLGQQILDFGVAVQDHAVDAVTQMVNKLAPDLNIGDGTVTEQVRAMEKRGDPRIRAFLDRIKGGDEPGSVAERDYVYTLSAFGNREAVSASWN